MSSQQPSRRQFLKLSMATAATVFAPSSFAIPRRGWRQLSMYHLHTDEYLDVVYWIDGRYQPSQLQKISRFLRDHRTGEVRRIDPQLVDILHYLKVFGNMREPLQILSGYRSPTTNAMLRAKNRRVAKNSYHIQGRAVDIHVPAKRNLEKMRNLAVSLEGGGVGYYPRSEFIHVDTGPVRLW